LVRADVRRATISRSRHREHYSAGEVLVLRHVSWEGVGAFGEQLDARGVSWRYVDLFADQPLPDLRLARALLVMGGSMSVYEAGRYPFLREEITAIGEAVRSGMPTVGVCLGSQLLAAALGAAVKPNLAGKEVGWGSVRKTPAALTDPILGRFRAEETVLHWHGDVFELPEGAVALACSPLTPHQAFRWRSRAWGLLFHVEADPTLVRRWLGEPAMRAEAVALDPDLPERIVTEAPRYEGRLAHLQEAVLDALLGPAVLGRRSSHNKEDTGRTERF
jgi:GMP synthase (glutamine-hydrolysing)